MLAQHGGPVRHALRHVGSEIDQQLDLLCQLFVVTPLEQFGVGVAECRQREQLGGLGLQDLAVLVGQLLDFYLVQPRLSYFI